MNNSDYGYRKKVPYNFETALEKTNDALMEQGFGVLTTIDVKATIKKKLDKDIGDYTILGACNPKLASRALEAEQEIGLLLPCNVIVYKKDDEVYVSAMLPSVAMSFIGNPKLECVADEVEPKLKAAIDNI